MVLEIFTDVQKFKNKKELALNAAKLICMLCRKTLKNKKYFTLVLSGGKTPLILYKLLGRKPYNAEIDWKKTHLFWADERFVPASDTKSNFGAFCRIFKYRNKISKQNLHNINTDFKTHMLSAKYYETKLKKFFGAKKIPRFDLIILGIGSDGHSGSLFPYSKVLNERKKWASAVSVAKEKIKRRITLTLPVLNNAENILFLVSGKTKKNILGKISKLEKSTPAYPATLIKTKGKTYLFTDTNI